MSDLVSYLATIYVESAKFDIPPIYPVDIICRGIDKAPNGTDILGRVFAGLVAISGNSSCYINASSLNSNLLSGWDWQVCIHCTLTHTLSKILVKQYIFNRFDNLKFFFHYYYPTFKSDR